MRNVKATFVKSSSSKANELKLTFGLVTPADAPFLKPGEVLTRKPMTRQVFSHPLISRPCFLEKEQFERDESVCFHTVTVKFEDLDAEDPEVQALLCALLSRVGMDGAISLEPAQLELIDPAKQTA